MLPGYAALHLHKTFKHVLTHFHRYAGTIVLNFDLRVRFGGNKPDENTAFIPRELECVGQQIEQDALQLLAITFDCTGFRGDNLECDIALLR